MNKILFMLSASLLTLVSLNAFAVDTRDVAQLSALSDVRVVVNKREGLAAVQSTAFVNFAHESCAKAVFEASARTEDGVLFVKLNNMSGMDCMGPTQTYNYSVQISSDFRIATTKVVVLNPIKLNVRTLR